MLLLNNKQVYYPISEYDRLMSYIKDLIKQEVCCFISRIILKELG